MKKQFFSKRIFAMLLTLCFVFCIAGCKGGVTESGTSDIIYYIDEENNNVSGGGNGDANTDNTQGSTSGNNSNTAGNNSNTVSNNSGQNIGSSASADKSGKKEISMLTWWDFSESEKERKEAWEKKTGYTVKLVKTTQGLYSTKLASLVMAGNSPDLAAMSASSFPNFINKNLVIPINDYIDVKDKKLALDSMNATKYNGKYYGMDLKGSQFTQMFVIYYNKTMMESWGVEKTPTQLWNEGNWNWETFLELAQYMTGTKGGKSVTGFSVAAGSFWEYWSVSAGTSLVGYNASNSKFINNFSNSTVIKGWEFANDLLYTYKCAIPQRNLTDGNVAMTGGGQWYMWAGDYYDKNMTDEWSVVPWPSPKGQKATIPAQSQIWCLCKGGNNPKKSVEFLYYWLDLSNSKKKIYASEELKKVHEKLWDMDKSYTFAKGPISYSDVNAYDSLMKKLYTGGKSAITTTLNSNSSALDANLKLIEKDKVTLK